MLKVSLYFLFLQLHSYRKRAGDTEAKSKVSMVLSWNDVFEKDKIAGS